MLDEDRLYRDNLRDSGGRKTYGTWFEKNAKVSPKTTPKRLVIREQIIGGVLRRWIKDDDHNWFVANVYGLGIE